MIVVVKQMGRIVKYALGEIEKCVNFFWLHDGAS